MTEQRTVDMSVVIPTFRRPAELGEAIASVLAQQDATVEVFVADDCPLGSAEPVVQRFEDPRLTYLHNPLPSAGRPAIVRNLAWPHASGRFLHFLDDDDLVPHGHYAAAKAAFAAAPGVGVVFGRVEPFGADDGEVAEERAFFAAAARRAAACPRFGARWAFAARLFFAETMLVCGAALIRRDCIALLGGFDPGLPLMEDVDFYARAIRRFGAVFLDRVALDYRIGPSLMRRPEPPAPVGAAPPDPAMPIGHAEPADRAELVRQSYRRMHARYRRNGACWTFWR
jgi:glycosyltransferase involved in cell wall biosynthesis